jgi:hypothetical protein
MTAPTPRLGATPGRDPLDRPPRSARTTAKSTSQLGLDEAELDALTRDGII